MQARVREPSRTRARAGVMDRPGGRPSGPLVGLEIAALIAGLLAAAAVALVAGRTPRALGVAGFYAAATAAVFVAALLSRRAKFRTALATSVAAGTAAFLLADLLTDGPLFLPALLLWSSAAWLECRRSRLSCLAVAVTAVWSLGIGLLVITVLIAVLPRVR